MESTKKTLESQQPRDPGHTLIMEATPIKKVEYVDCTQDKSGATVDPQRASTYSKSQKEIQILNVADSSNRNQSEQAQDSRSGLRIPLTQKIIKSKAFKIELVKNEEEDERASSPISLQKSREAEMATVREPSHLTAP